MTSDQPPAGDASDASDATVAAVQAAADRAARAGVQIRELTRPEMPAAAGLLSEVWQTGSAAAPMDAPLLIALAHAGNHCAGAFDGERLVGVCVGFFATPLGEVLHSHITGVRSPDASRGIGAALKLHQRAWCAERGLRTITWTYDPLIARNAWFNLHRLGARAVAYLPEFYATVPDGTVAEQSGDRMLVSWPVLPDGAPPAAPDASQPGVFRVLTRDSADEPILGGRAPASATRCAVRIPRDIEGIRRANPRLGLRWRDATRRSLGGLLDDGWRITGFDPSAAYVLERESG